MFRRSKVVSVGKVISKEVWEELKLVWKHFGFKELNYTRLAAKIYPEHIVYTVEGKNYIVIDK